MKMSLPANTTGYNPGHPWYYKLGGQVLTPKQIKQTVLKAKRPSYMWDQFRIWDKRPEPTRSYQFRKMESNVREDMADDLRRYYELARKLRHHRSGKGALGSITCDDLYTAISLKHNHLYNDFTILHELQLMLSVQADLFG